MPEIKINKENFKNEVMVSNKPVLLDFWADWCGPCKMLEPIIEEIAENYDGKIKVGKINVDEQQELAAAFNVESIPTVLIIKNGKITDVSVGYKPKCEIEKMIKL